MDHRIKSFEVEAVAAFAFLDQRGFLHTAEPTGRPDRRPFSLKVSFRSPETTVETSLILEHAGDDNVVTTVHKEGSQHDLVPGVARKGHEMRNALHTHSHLVQQLLEA